MKQDALENKVKRKTAELNLLIGSISKQQHVINKARINHEFQKVTELAKNTLTHVTREFAATSQIYNTQMGPDFNDPESINPSLLAALNELAAMMMTVRNLKKSLENTLAHPVTIPSTETVTRNPTLAQHGEPSIESDETASTKSLNLEMAVDDTVASSDPFEELSLSDDGDTPNDTNSIGSEPHAAPHLPYGNTLLALQAILQDDKDLRPNDEERYHLAYQQLKNLKFIEPIQSHINKLFRHIDQCKPEDASKKVLTDVLEKTYHLLKGGPEAISHTEYHQFAETLPGHARPWLQTLGVLMIAIGTTVSILLAATISPILGGIAAGVGVGAGLYTLFNASAHGLSRAMSNISAAHAIEGNAALGNPATIAGIRP